MCIRDSDMTAAERKESGIESLPGDLMAAIQELQKDELIKTALGEHTYNHFIKAKQIEWNVYKTQVHQWELDQYLETF